MSLSKKIAVLTAALTVLFSSNVFASREQFDVLEKQITEQKVLRKNQGRYRDVCNQTYNPQSLILVNDRNPVDIILRRTKVLVEHISEMPDAKDMTAFATELKALEVKCLANTSTDRNDLKNLFNEIATLRRKISFSNPLIDFNDLVFIKRHFCPNGEKQGNHMCDQYFGFNAYKGGGLFILKDAFSDKPTEKNVLSDSVCGNNRLQGRKLDENGGFLAPELSFDGKKLLFAYTDIETPRKAYKWNDNNTYNVFSVNVDGTDLRQLTDGPVNDFDPCFLPSGRIAFISERRGGYGRCHGRPVPSFTLHSMAPDGSDIVMLSPHETNEWQPSVDHNGMIIYTRWDYVDRGFNQAHHPWITTPDGRDSRAIQGNFGANWGARPFFEADVRAIPDSKKLVATAACHHGQAYGSLVIVDPEVVDNDGMDPVKRLTPEQLFPEAEIGTHGPPANYASAWPLSENFYICVYDPESRSNKGHENSYGIYLIDSFGNRELLWRDPKISCLSPIPLKARTKPAIVPHMTLVGAGTTPNSTSPAPEDLPKTAEVGVIDVYNSQNPFEEGTNIKQLRIIELLPKTTPFGDNPRIGHGNQKSARLVLGTVPVNEDGSAYFNLPIDVPVYFQALDENGVVVQSMRSATYVHPGEKLVCQGCHENRHATSKQTRKFPKAMRRKASDIKPEMAGSNPFSYPILVQPVLDDKCISCHKPGKDAPDLTAGDFEKNRHNFYTSYVNLRPYSFFYESAVWTEPKTYPGKFGANASKLYKLLKAGHYDVELSPEQMRRITLWLDSNSDFFGSYANIKEQAKGEVVQPTLR